MTAAANCLWVYGCFWSWWAGLFVCSKPVENSSLPKIGNTYRGTGSKPRRLQHCLRSDHAFLPSTHAVALRCLCWRFTGAESLQNQVRRRSSICIWALSPQEKGQRWVLVALTLLNSSPMAHTSLAVADLIWFLWTSNSPQGAYALLRHCWSTAMLTSLLSSGKGCKCKPWGSLVPPLLHPTSCVSFPGPVCKTCFNKTCEGFRRLEKLS